MSSLVDRLWYGQGRPLRFLAPLAWLYQAIADARRRKAWEAKDEALSVPVVVVGNITAGGTGKSPLTAWLVSELCKAGWRPVILSRGYGGKSTGYPLQVNSGTDPDIAGDEPVMLAQMTGAPVVVDPVRRRAAAWALEKGLGSILVCDDGLQHYQLPRDVEIAVFDGARGIGNGALIPVGPLREPVSRLNSVDYLVVNGGDTASGGRPAEFSGIEHPGIHTMTLVPSALINLKTGETRPPDALQGQRVRAVAGIGNPGRFFDTLRHLGALVTESPFPDHHQFKPAELDPGGDDWVVMTAKDAVKCRRFAPDNAWALAVQARMSAEFTESVISRIAECAAQLSRQPTLHRE